MKILTKNILFCVLLLSPSIVIAKQIKKVKNILFVAFDDLRPELNCFGKSDIYSPNIDQFAREGVSFQRAYCNIPVSGASRASLLTGTRPTRNTFLTARTYAQKQKKDKTALNDYLKSLGYHTEVRGKVFHFADDHEDGWTVCHKKTYIGSLNARDKDGKRAFYESLDVPLIIYDPSSTLRGYKCNEIVEFVDIFPTICEAVGVEIPTQVEGKSIFSLLKDEKSRSKGYAVCRWQQGYTLITNDSLFYTEWWKKDDQIEGRMLFDHKVDSAENINVVNQEQYADCVWEMSKKLKECRGREFDKY